MRKAITIKRFYILLLALILALSSLSALASTIPDELPVGILSASARLYKKASTKDGTVTTLKADTEIEIIGETKSYYRVVAGNKAGYILKKYIALAGAEMSTSSPVTTGQKNALSSAKSYLKILSFSYEGLIKQLEYEKYSHEDAVYAVDNCGADWYDQAAKKAESYLSFMAFSRDRLIAQLEYEGFTREQAVYGVEANGY